MDQSSRLVAEKVVALGGDSTGAERWVRGWGRAGGLGLFNDGVEGQAGRGFGYHGFGGGACGGGGLLGCGVFEGGLDGGEGGIAARDAGSGIMAAPRAGRARVACSAWAMRPGSLIRRRPSR